MCTVVSETLLAHHPVAAVNPITDQEVNQLFDYTFLIVVYDWKRCAG